MSAERNSGKFSDRVLLLGEGDQVVLTHSVPPPLSLFRATMKKNVKEPVRDCVR